MPPLVVIVGETGSGKTALGITLAKRFNGEIISADSRTVYRGMDIGTAKPTMLERQGIPHYGFDVVDPDEQFTAYDFQQLARSAIADIASRGKLPIMVGGTGLYVDAVLYDFAFRPQADPKLRANLLGVSVEELQARVHAAGLSLPVNTQNPRHLIRILEAGAAPQQSRTLRPNTLVLGLHLPSEELESKLTGRIETMLKAGLVDEVRQLLARYGENEALRTPGYRAFSAYLRGEIDHNEAVRRFIRDDLRLAKRQRTWFRRNSAIHWLEGDDKKVQAEQLVANFLDI